MTAVSRRDFVAFILLNWITCGIYGLIFWYQFAKDINRVCDGDGNHTTDFITVILLSIITCGIYQIFWYYNLGNRIYNNGPRYGVTINENGTTVLLWFVIGMVLTCGLASYVALYYIIRNANLLFESYNRYIFGNPGMPGMPGQF